MPAIKQVVDYIGEIAPWELAEDWDNPGLLVDCGGETDRILVALDITPEVVEEAAKRGCSLIVAHHPVIFKPLRSVAATGPVAALLRHGISALCAHTNLDAAVGGVNDVLARRLGLEQVRAFAAMGRVGQLPSPLSGKELAAFCKEKLSANVLFTDAGKPVSAVAVLGGSGGDFLWQAKEAGADALVTGEAGHHDGLDALELGITLVVAGHYATEWPVVPALAKRLAERFPDSAVLVSSANRDPFTALL